MLHCREFTWTTHVHLARGPKPALSCHPYEVESPDAIDREEPAVSNCGHRHFPQVSCVCCGILPELNFVCREDIFRIVVPCCFVEVSTPDRVGFGLQDERIGKRERHDGPE